jgi:hypothetical protein
VLSSKKKSKALPSLAVNQGARCKFGEPVMNDLIDQIFGDVHITLMCRGGECLHYSLVPGYVVRPFAFFLLEVNENAD